MKWGRNFEVYRWILSRFWWFLADVLNSEATRKFSKGRRHMFKVSRMCAYIRALQRTNSCDHTTSHTFFIEGKVTKTWFLMKSGRNFEVYRWILSRFWWFLADVLTSEATRKFSKGRRRMFKVSRRCAYIRASQRTNSRDHTTSHTFLFCETVTPPQWPVLETTSLYEGSWSFT